ncbi:lantibiotic immunity ABC transporter MutG family permease subunit [Lachnospiraceae bacterium]|jgi:lantibiotic protection ABC transporter MutG family permease subunit|nr:lantibiotic immunity ABC transporter MutG family permease subunit [uncultured Schaedlerella sp.]NBI60725.1 lantibiotic immunity ABC transporter MutG family permease subunit [Lachnospiraceae bacterium]
MMEAVRQGELLRLIKAEFWKVRHTLLTWIHLLVPLLGIAVFLMYYSWSGWSDEGKVSGYIQVLSIAFPMIISVVCSLSVEMEEQGHFQTMLGAAAHKGASLLAKWILLAGMGLGSMLLAVGGFAAGYGIMTGRMVYAPGQYLGMAAVLWLGGANLYLFHLFLNLAFSKTISMCAGTAELLTAALFLTGLGEGLWQFFPCSWGGRWCGYLLLYWKGNGAVSAGFIFRSLMAGMVLTAVLWGTIFLWYHFYEGRQCHD